MNHTCQASQIMMQLCVPCFNRVGVRLAIRDFILAKVIPQPIISIESIAIILLGFGSLIHHVLNGVLCTFPNHFTSQKAASFPIYKGQNIDPVFFSPMKVNNSFISASLTSSGTGAPAKLAACALTHRDTVRW